MACQTTSHPETLRGQRYSMPCPTAKNWAPFVRGCAPEDAGANHDMRRVRLLDEQTVLATTGPANQPTGGSVLPSRRPQGLRRLSPADQRPGRITPAGDLTSSSPYPRHLTAMQKALSLLCSFAPVCNDDHRKAIHLAHLFQTPFQQLSQVCVLRDIKIAFAVGAQVRFALLVPFCLALFVFMRLVIVVVAWRNPGHHKGLLERKYGIQRIEDA